MTSSGKLTLLLSTCAQLAGGKIAVINLTVAPSLLHSTASAKDPSPIAHATLTPALHSHGSHAAAAQGAWLHHALSGLRRIARSAVKVQVFQGVLLRV